MKISIKREQSQTGLSFAEREKFGPKVKKIFQWALAAILICGASVFTACSSNDDNPAEGGTPGIAMIVKSGQIDYWRQIETAFRGICQEKGLEAYYYATTSDNAYQEQASAVKELRKLGSKALKAIVFAPCYGVNGESAEAEVAALAKERGIPVVILDSPAKAAALASCPYFGTDNTAAGKALAEKVAADKVAVFAMTPGPGIERAEAFKALKPAATVYPVGDNAVSEVQAVLSEFDDFVFFNGSPLLDVLPMLKAAGKRVYTFDAYSEFIDELASDGACLQGIMAQNTFGMARKAVDAVLANAKQGEMVPTFYITEDNLDDANVKPFLEFYNIPAAIDNLGEKILGKWIETEVEGRPALTNEKAVTTFVSATKALFSSSLPDYTEKQAKWSDRREYAVKITGNKVSLTGHPESDPTITLIEDFFISSVTATEIVCRHRHTTIRGGQGDVSFNEQNVRLTKADIDYRQDVIGTWEGKNSEGWNERWEIKADGTYVYSRKVGDGDWELMVDIFNQYVVDGYMFYARWKNDTEGEQRQWWEIESIQNGVMKWKSLRQNADGTTFTATVEMEKIQ